MIFEKGHLQPSIDVASSFAAEHGTTDNDEHERSPAGPLAATGGFCRLHWKSVSQSSRCVALRCVPSVLSSKAAVRRIAVTALQELEANPSHHYQSSIHHQYNRPLVLVLVPTSYSH